MQAPRYQVSYYLISEVIKEKQQNWRLDLFHKENTDKGTIDLESQSRQDSSHYIPHQQNCKLNSEL